MWVHLISEGVAFADKIHCAFIYESNKNMAVCLQHTNICFSIGALFNVASTSFSPLVLVEKYQ